MSTDPRDEALKRIEAYGRRVRLYTEDPCGETTAELIDAKAALTAYTENRLAEISRLTAELEEARKDAGRYRWLRNESRKMGNRVPHISQHPFIEWLDETEYPYWPEVGLDAAIDAAMTKEKP